MTEVTRPDGRTRIIKYPEGKFDSCIVDTISAPMVNLYRKINKGKMTTVHEWKDYGWEAFDLYDEIKALPDTSLVQILGKEGTGKTVGGKFLNPEHNGWINADGKPLSFFGARGMYPEDKSKKNYSTVNTYEEILGAIKAMHSKRRGHFTVFMLGHIEDYKGAMDMMFQRLAIPGKQATKLKIEGLNVFATYYTKIISSLPSNDPNRYRLQVNTTGYDTARTPEGYHVEEDIPNNYQIILDKILEDYGELKPLEQ